MRCCGLSAVCLHLEDMMVHCCRAQKLITGLGGEKSRWTAAAEQLGHAYVQLTGDVLLAAAQVAYLGAFTTTYRTACLKGWVQTCTLKGIPCSERFKLAVVLGDPVQVCILSRKSAAYTLRAGMRMHDE